MFITDELFRSEHPGERHSTPSGSSLCFPFSPPDDPGDFDSLDVETSEDKGARERGSPFSGWVLEYFGLKGIGIGMGIGTGRGT